MAIPFRRSASADFPLLLSFLLSISLSLFSSLSSLTQSRGHASHLLPALPLPSPAAAVVSSQPSPAAAASAAAPAVATRLLLLLLPLPLPLPSPTCCCSAVPALVCCCLPRCRPTCCPAAQPTPVLHCSSVPPLQIRNVAQTGEVAHRKLLAIPVDDQPKKQKRHLPPLSSESPRVAPLSSPSPSPIPPPSFESPSSSPSPSPAPPNVPTPDLMSNAPNVPTPDLMSNAPVSASPPSPSHYRVLILSVAIGGPALLFILVIGIFFCRGSKVAAVKPWATGLSGQLQKAFVTGVPNLKRSELETACEDFSNVIGSSLIGTVYKGTLSNGVEIAVVSVAVISAKDWSKNLETQFRTKIDTLSKLNHKNFVNLLGYCEEEEPFTRMMVFEYAPNGTLFEHLHIKEAEHLDWEMRMRIVMGMAYCLEHMHQSTQPIAHKNLNSLTVNLTEDYAAKISDFGLWNEVGAAEMKSNPESNVYSFGVILFEMITGRLPYATNSDWLEYEALDYLRGKLPLREMVDPTLKSFQVEQLEKIGLVIKSCVHPDPKQRPTMREVSATLREITAIGPDGAIPKLSPLWWAQLEILSTEAS